MLAKIQPAVDQTKAQHGEEGTPEVLNACVAQNVVQMCDEVRAQSSILAEMEAKGEIILAGGVYNVSTGKVAFTGQSV